MAYGTWVGTSHNFVSKLVPKLRPPTHNRGRGGVGAPDRAVCCGCYGSLESPLTRAEFHGRLCMTFTPQRCGGVAQCDLFSDLDGFHQELATTYHCPPRPVQPIGTDTQS